MHQPHYPFSIQNKALRFDFLSVGKRLVSKSVIYTQIDASGVYSLALLDVYTDDSTDDSSVTDNGDMEKILVTVFQTFAVFFKEYPAAVVAFEGSTPSRTRLYRIALSHELAGIGQTYNVWGLTSDGYKPFQKNHPYTGFLLSAKRQ